MQFSADVTAATEVDVGLHVLIGLATVWRVNEQDTNEHRVCPMLLYKVSQSTRYSIIVFNSWY